jgi:hypothetical protein
MAAAVGIKVGQAILMSDPDNSWGKDSRLVFLTRQIACQRRGRWQLLIAANNFREAATHCHMMPMGKWGWGGCLISNRHSHRNPRSDWQGCQTGGKEGLKLCIGLSRDQQVLTFATTASVLIWASLLSFPPPEITR